VYILICLLCTHAELAQFSLSAVVAAPSCSRHKLSHRTMAQHADLGLAVHSDRNKPTGSDGNVIGVAPSQDRFRFHFSLAHVTYLFNRFAQSAELAASFFQTFLVFYMRSTCVFIVVCVEFFVCFCTGEHSKID
jgi:hypothetical protein